MRPSTNLSETLKASTITPSGIFSSKFNDGIISLEEAKKSIQNRNQRKSTNHADKIKILVNERKDKVSKIKELEK